MQAEGQRVYLLDDAASLKAFDLTDPQKPRPIAPIENADKIKTRIESEIKAFNNEDKMYRDHFKILLEKRQDDGRWGDQLTILDITKKNAPKRLSSFARMENSWETIEKYGITDDRLFVVNVASWKFCAYSFSVYDITKPEKPLLLGSFGCELGEIPGNVAMSGDRIYLADQDRGLIVLRFAKPVKSPYTRSACVGIIQHNILSSVKVP